MPSIRYPLCALFSVGILVAPRAAFAYEDQYRFDASLGYAQLLLEDGTLRHGLGASASGSLGISDLFELRAIAHWNAEPGSPLIQTGGLSAEFFYLFDLLSLVPYAGIGAGGYVRYAEDDFDIDAGVNLVLGIDYHYSREMLFGFDIRPHLLVTALDESPFLTTFQFRVSWMFDQRH